MKTKLSQLFNTKNKLLTFGTLLLLVVVIVAIPLVVRAVTSSGVAVNTVVAPSFETESGTSSECTSSVSDSTASNSKAVQYGTCTPVSTPTPTPATTYGANFPISYSLSSLTGTVYYVSTTGSDTNSGSASAPFATLAKATSTAASGSSIVVRGGTYRGQPTASISASKGLHITAYPNETPTFDGTQQFASGWTADGSLQYHDYTALAVSPTASGIAFGSNQNLTSSTGYVGYFPDQAWIGNTQLQQVTSQAAVTAGKFYVDSANKRMYLTSTDVAKGSIMASSSTQHFMDIRGSNTTIDGLKITRYADSGAQNGVITVYSGTSNLTFNNVEISYASFFTMTLSGNPTIIKNPVFNHVTITGSNFMGIESTYVDGLTIENSKLDNGNQFGEFTSSPVSGGLKTSKNWDIVVNNNEIANNKTHGLWFDQSNERVTVANNRFSGNTGDAVFFEISDNLYMINNYVDSRGGAQGLKAAGSSGLHLVNNTFVGGADNVGIYTDSRSVAGCAADGCSAVQYQSDRDKIRVRPATLDWLPRIDLMINNVFAYPTSSSYCNVVTPICITLNNGTAAQAPINTIIHKADSARGIPQTVIDGNVYAASASGNLITTSSSSASTKYTSLSSWTAALGAAPIGIPGDSNAKTGSAWVLTNGQPTTALTAANGSAVAVPTNASINPYLSAGTKRYGFGF